MAPLLRAHRSTPWRWRPGKQEKPEPVVETPAAGKTTTKKLSMGALKTLPIRERGGEKGAVAGEHSCESSGCNFEVVIYVKKKPNHESQAESGGDSTADSGSSIEGQRVVSDYEKELPDGPQGAAVSSIVTGGAVAEAERHAAQSPPADQTSTDKKSSGEPDIRKLAVVESLDAPRTYPRNKADKTAATGPGKRSAVEETTAGEKTGGDVRRDDSEFEYCPLKDSDENYKASTVSKMPGNSAKKRVEKTVLRKSGAPANVAGRARKVAIRSVRKEKVGKTASETATEKVFVEQAGMAVTRSSADKKASMALAREGEGEDGNLSEDTAETSTHKRPASPVAFNEVKKIGKTTANSSVRNTKADIGTAVITSTQGDPADGPVPLGQGVQKPSSIPLRQVTTSKRLAPPAMFNKVKEMGGTTTNRSVWSTKADIEIMLVASTQCDPSGGSIPPDQRVQKPSSLPPRQPLWFSLGSEAEASGSESPLFSALNSRFGAGVGTFQ